jgi:addiction module HigA family antidote
MNLFPLRGISAKVIPMAIMFNPPYPGRVLREYLGEMEVSEAAAMLGASPTTLSSVLNVRAGISTEMSFRLSEALRMRPEVWSRLQLDYDLWHASRKNRARVEPFVKEFQLDPADSEDPISV